MKKLVAYILVVAMVMAPLLFTPARANSPNIAAPIAVVMCFETGDILYDRNMNQRWIPASMTKIMTAFITYEEIAAGNLTASTQITVSANAARFSNDRRVQGTFIPMTQGSSHTVETLLQLVMLPSGNAAALVLAEHIAGTEAAFVERMNQTAEDLGMYSSFTNSHGAHAHHTNAYSVAVLIREFISRHPDILRITAMPSMRFGGSTHNNTNRLLPGRSHAFRGADGFKTGTIRAAGWNHSTTAVRDGRRVIAVVMNAANNDQRQAQSRTLLQFGFDELARRDVAAAERVRVFHRGEAIPLNAPAIVDNGCLFLPMSDMLRPLGFTLSWDSENRVATATNSDGDINVPVDRSSITVRGRSVNVSTPARMFDSRVYVSLEIVEAMTNTTAHWDRNTGMVNFRAR